MIRLYGFVIVILILGTVMYGGYSYFKDSQETIQALKVSVSSYENAIKNTTKALDNLRQESERIEKINSDLQIKLQDAEKYKDGLIQKLNKHNLTKLSVAKPGLIEKRVNDSTTKIFKELEDITALPTISQ